MGRNRWLLGMGRVLLVGAGAAVGFAAYGQQIPEPQMHFFSLVDADKDGVITRAEYNAYREAQMARHDANKDGVVTIEEFRAVSPGRGVEARFKALDKDGDGKITKAEWDAETDAMFSARDADKNGKLTPNEMGPMHRGPMPMRGMPAK